MNVAIISGSFDPITNGHMHIVKQASETFNSVIVTIATNPNKKYEFSIEQRKQKWYSMLLMNINYQT
jgi:pantetheine-phosphate adenylyltransferase